MNREIKFRGKEVNTKKWVYGGIVKSFNDNNFYIINSMRIFYIHSSKNQKVQVPLHSEFAYKVINETVGQFTGLLDKRGKEIYEGDIVKIGTENILCKVYFNQDYGHFYAKNFLGGDIWLNFTTDGKTNVEVIGNIYDTPELLKGK